MRLVECYSKVKIGVYNEQLSCNGHLGHSLSFNKSLLFNLSDLGLSIKVAVHRQNDFPDICLAHLWSFIVFSMSSRAILRAATDWVIFG